MEIFKFNVKGLFVVDGYERFKLNATYKDNAFSLQVDNYGIFQRFVEQLCIDEYDVKMPLDINQFNGTNNKNNRFMGKIEFKFSSYNKNNQMILLNYTDVAIHIVDLKTKQTYIMGGLVSIYGLWHPAEHDMMHPLNIESNSSKLIKTTASTELINEMLQLNHINMKYVDMKKDVKPEKENQKPMLISQAIWEQFKFISLGYLEPLVGIFILSSIAFLVTGMTVGMANIVISDWMNLSDILKTYLGFPEQVSQSTCGGIIIFISIILTSHILRISRIPQFINDAFKPNLDKRLIPTTSEFNEIYEFENYPYQSFRAYEFIDIKRSNEHQIVLDFRHMGGLIKTISNQQESLILDNQHSNIDPRKLAMVNHVSSEKMTFEEIEKVEALIKNYHETVNSLKYQKEVKKYDELYTSHASKKGQTQFQASLNEVEDELRKHDQELQMILQGKSQRR